MLGQVGNKVLGAWKVVRGKTGRFDDGRWLDKDGRRVRSESSG